MTTDEEEGMTMSISSNVGRSCKAKPCSFAKCKRQMKNRCGEMSLSGDSFGNWCRIPDRVTVASFSFSSSSFSSFSYQDKQMEILLLTSNKKRRESVWLVYSMYVNSQLGHLRQSLLCGPITCPSGHAHRLASTPYHTLHLSCSPETIIQITSKND